jgi:hypothetical protein
MRRLYPQVSAEEWIRRYPSLRLKRIKCRGCKATLENNLPYRNEHSAGLECPPCPCGGHPGFFMATLLSQQMISAARNLLSSVQHSSSVYSSREVDVNSTPVRSACKESQNEDGTILNFPPRGR